jgi:DMSO/TMAO reductase YedYZ heme-binding membrane subunit
MKKFLTPGTITAVLSVAAIMAGAFGYDALAKFLNDPGTITTVLTVVGAAGTLIAGLLDGVKKTDVAP